MNFPDRDREQSKGEKPLPAVSAQTLARWLGVSPKVVYDLTKADVLEHGAGRLYPQVDSVRRYYDQIRPRTVLNAALPALAGETRTGRLAANPVVRRPR